MDRKSWVMASSLLVRRAREGSVRVRDELEASEDGDSDDGEREGGDHGVLLWAAGCAALLTLLLQRKSGATRAAARRSRDSPWVCGELARDAPRRPTSPVGAQSDDN